MNIDDLVIPCDHGDDDVYGESNSDEGGFGFCVEPANHPVVIRPFVNECTFNKTNKKFTMQFWKRCLICHQEGQGCCLNCVSVCHSSHEVSQKLEFGSFFCDCGASGNCDLISPFELKERGDAHPLQQCCGSGLDSLDNASDMCVVSLGQDYARGVEQTNAKEGANVYVYGTKYVFQSQPGKESRISKCARRGCENMAELVLERALSYMCGLPSVVCFDCKQAGYTTSSGIGDGKTYIYKNGEEVDQYSLH